MFSTKQPIEPRKLANVSGYDVSSNEEGPVPYFAGVAKIALTWVTPPYNLRSETVEEDGKKNTTGGGGQKKWYGDIAGFTNVCPDDAPTDALLFLLVNDEVAFTGPLPRVPGTHHAAFTVDMYCQEAWIRWGTKDHPLNETLILGRRGVPPTAIEDPAFRTRDQSTWPRLDAAGEPVGDAPVPGVANPRSGHYDLHSAYRNFTGFEFRQFYLGSSPNMPSVVAVMARGTKFFNGARFEAEDDGVNPMGPIYEILTDDFFGADVTEDSIGIATFEAEATALTAQNILIAPVLRTPATLRGLFPEYGEYYDGWFRRNGSLLEAGHFDHGAIDESGLVTLGADDLAGEVSVLPVTLDDTKNYFYVKFTNRERWWTDDTATDKNLANLEEVQEKREDRTSKLFILSATAAQRYATERCLMRSKPGGGSGSANFLSEKTDALLPGDRFKTNSVSFGLTMLMRILGKVDPGAGEGVAQIKYSIEPAKWSDLYQQPPAPKDPDFTIGIQEIDEARIVELPSGLRDRFTPSLLQVAVLALRPSAYVLGFRTHISLDDVTYDVAAEQRTFAVWGKVKEEAYIAGTDDLDTTVGMVVALYGEDLDSIVALSDQQRDDYTGLWFGGSEIGTRGNLIALGAGLFRIFGRRAIYDTIKQLHPIDEDIWFVFRKELHPIENANFTNGATVYFKLQPFTATQAVEVGDLDPIEHDFPALPPELLAPFGLKIVRYYQEEPSPGVFEAHIVFTWAWSLEQDVDDFDISWRAGGINALLGEWSQLTIAAAGETISDGFGTPYEKRQSYDLMVGPSNLSHEVRVRGIDSAGVPTDWSPLLSRRAVTSTRVDPNRFLHFTSQAELEAYSVVDLNLDTIVFVTMDAGGGNISTHTRQLQTGAPDTLDWAVLNEPSKRWRQTGGT